MTQRVILTREGYDKLKKDLEHLMTTKRREIAKDLKEARAHGDLRENAEYDAAKNNQALNEKRIATLSERLTSVEILDDSRIQKDKVLLGATVTLKDMKSGEKFQYIMVSAEEADFTANKIAISSPIGKALLGHKVNDIVSIQVPAGELKYKVLEITR